MALMLYDPHRAWGQRAICRPEDHKLFFAESAMNREPGAKTRDAWDQAKEICRMCPVREECARDTLGEPYGVWGGLDQWERFKVRTALRKAVERWPEERRLAWGEELTRLREGGLIWRSIQRMTGISEAPGIYLVAYWEEHRPKPVEVPARVVELSGLRLARTPFPDKAGRRHAWVRHRGSVSDAWYRGQTADGEWINCTTWSGRGNVNKWFRKNDVHLYRPQAVVIMRYPGRPDDASHGLTA